MEYIIAFAMGMVVAGIAYLVVVWPNERGRWRRGYMAGYMDALSKGDDLDDADTVI